MADFWIVGGLMAGAFVSPLYFLAMRWLSGPRRVAISVLIGGMLFATSISICSGSAAGHDLSLADIMARLSMLVLTLGWFVCAQFHVLGLLAREWVPQRALFAARG